MVDAHCEYVWEKLLGLCIFTILYNYQGYFSVNSGVYVLFWVRITDYYGTKLS